MKKKTKIISGTVAAIALLTTGFVGYTFRDRLLVTESRANTTEYKLATEHLTEQIASDNTDNNDIQKNILLAVGTGYLNTLNNYDELPAEEEVIIAEADDNTSGSLSIGNNTGNNPQTPSGSNSQTPAAPTGNSGSNTQTPAVSNTQTPAAPSGNNGSGSGGSSTAGNQGSNAGKTWHPPVYEEVWVVDREAWTEEVPVYETKERVKCGQCGAIMYTQEDVDYHLNNSLSCYSYYSEYYQVQVGTNTVNWPEEGHYERKLVKEGYWE